jgi:hypothetical protein
MINPDLMNLLETQDNLDILADSVKYQLEKFQNVQKTNEGRDWYLELPQIIKEKFDNYLEDYEKLSRILKLSQEEIVNEMKKGYYFWRLLHSACNTYRNDLAEYDQQLFQEFNLKETSAISDNAVLNQCIEVLDKHVIES